VPGAEARESADGRGPLDTSNAAWALHEAGAVHLTQHRELREMKDGTGFRVHYHYRATRARAKVMKPVRPSVSAAQVEKAT
jgi:hypothetical protein